jgi:hypothetical protein
MDAKYYAYNQSRGCFLSGSLTPVDAGLEPLRVLKVLIEGLTPDAKSGLWLTHFRSVPVARTLSPFDLVYLDSDFRVVHAVELSTDGEFAPFRGQPSSALVLPYQSLASTQTRTGDQLIVRLAEDSQPASSHRAASSTRITEAALSESEVAATGLARQVSAAGKSTSPLDQFLAQQSAISAGRGRVQQTAKSLLELSQAERAVPAVQTSLAQNASAMAEAATAPRPAIHAVPSALPQAPEHRSGPTRTSRIAPPPATPSPSQPSGKATWKVAQFPARNTAPAASNEPQFDPSDIDIPSQPPEKLSLLMRILRLQFIRNDRTSLEEDALDTAQARKPASSPRSVPEWAMRFLRWLYPELEISTVSEVAVRPSYHAKSKFRQEFKPSPDLKFFKWIYPDLAFDRPQPEAETGPVDRRLTARLLKPGLVAYYFTGGPPRAHKIANISVTGFYMNTDERWMPGTIIRMTLQMIGTSGEGPTDTLTVHSRVVRWGPDGEGFEFVLAGFLDERLPISYGRSPRITRRLES